MSALVSTSPTLLDLRQSLDSNDMVDRVIEILAQSNPIYEDMPMIECNELTGHVTTIRTGIPEPTFRKLYGFVTPSKTTRAKIRDAVGMLEDYGKVDKALADLNSNAAAFRLSEDKGKIQGFANKVARYVFYGNAGTEPEAFTGIAPRYNALSGFEAAENVLDGGSNDTDNTSIYLVGWSPETVHGLYPKGSRAGIQVTDKGVQTVQDTVGGTEGMMEAYLSHYRQDIGFCVRDWRYIVRIANIEVSDLTKTGGTGADLIDLMSQATELVPENAIDDKGIRWAFYANRVIKSFLKRQQANAVSNSTLTMENVGGKHVLSFEGIPVRRCDAIRNDETLLV